MQRPTPPTSPLQISRREASEAGNITAICDEFVHALGATIRSSERKPVDGKAQLTGADDPMILPSWAFKVLLNLALVEMTTGKRKRAKNATSIWKQYKADMKHWHRYACVKAAIERGRAHWPIGRPAPSHTRGNHGD
jgi:hypothetical protein